jgi:hypothetical protein
MVWQISISIPRDIKVRMDQIEEVDWSQVACQAFELKLNEILLQEKLKREEDYKLGYKAGHVWARDSADAMELEGLARFKEKPIYSSMAGLPSNYTAELVYFILATDYDHPRESSYEFWKKFRGSNLISNNFVCGFVDGAVRQYESYTIVSEGLDKEGDED